jgi:transcriptional regulator with XRE-family HTH domain
MPAMPDDVSVGRQVQAVRLARGLRQADVAVRAGVSRASVSRLERGQFEGMTIATIRAISRAMRMPGLARLGWVGPEVDRLLDRVHATMVEQAAGCLERVGWSLAPEHSFSHFGERGAVDLLGWHAATRTLLIVEIKSRIWDLQDTLSTIDRKRRLLPGLVPGSLGWQPRHVGVLLVMPETRGHRRVVERHAATFRAALPARQVEVSNWLEHPARDLRGIWFLNNVRGVNVMQRSTRKRSRKKPGGSDLHAGSAVAGA